MCFGLDFLSGDCSPEDRTILSGSELHIGLSWDAIDGDILVPPLECSEEDQEELSIPTQCVMPISVREYTRKEKGKEKMIAHEEKLPPSSMVKFQYWQDRNPLCQNICAWFNDFITSVFGLGPPRFLVLCVKTIKYEQMPAYYCPFPNFSDPQLGMWNWMWRDYADRIVVNVPEEAREILGDSSTAVLTMMFFAFVRTGYSDLVGTESFTHNLLHGGWNMALQRPPRQTEPISSVHADGVPTGHRGMSASNADDYSIRCPSPVSSAFLGLDGNREFGTQIYSWRESPSWQRTESSYGRALDYSNLGLFRLLKNPNRMTDPPTTEFQQVLHSGQEGAERERQCSIGWTTYGAWNVSNKTRELKRGISASPSSHSLESHLSSLLFVLDSPRDRAEELSLNSGSIYGALGGIGSKARDSLPGRASGNSVQSSRTMRGWLKNNVLMLITNGEQSIRSGCTSFHIAATSNDSVGIQYGPFRFRMEQDGSTTCVIDDSKLRSGSGQSLKNIGCRVGAYIGLDKCAICQEGWTGGRSPEIAKSRDGCEWVLAKLPTYLGPGWPWAERRIREINSPGGYPSGSVSRGSAMENIPHAAHTRMSSEEPINASYTRSNISEGNLNSVGSDLIRSNAAWSTAAESTQPTVLSRRRSLLESQSNDYVTNDSLELPHPVDFSSLGSLQLTATPNADSFECEYWERYGIEIGEEGEGGWRDLGQLVSEEGIFGGSATTAWPHSRAYTEAGIRGKPFHSKGTAPPRLRPLLRAAELLELVSFDLRLVSQTDLGFLDSAVSLLYQFIRTHKEAYDGAPRGYTNTGNCPGRRPKGTGPHSRAHTEAGIRGEPSHLELPAPVSGDALVKSTAPPKLRPLLRAAELMESVSFDLRLVSQTNLGFLDSAVLLLDLFIQAHKEAYGGAPRGYTNTGNCPGRRPKGTSPSDWEGLFREAGSQTEPVTSLTVAPESVAYAQVITGESSISKSLVSSAEETGTEPVTSLTVAPESVTYAREKQAGRKDRFGFLDKGSSFNTTAPGCQESSASGTTSRNISGTCSGTAVSLIPSRADTKPKATTARGSVLSSSGNDQFSTAAVSLATKMKPPFPSGISYPKSQEFEVQRINQKGSKIPVFVKKAGGRRDIDERPLNIITPIPRNRENSPFNSMVPASSLRRLLFERKNLGEHGGSPTLRKIGSRLPYKRHEKG
ncbi:hypothetical protein B9Z19DRAFT_1063905 [Tuber borchii]|uniref:Uncharacterized protein n=1 Tax=Tuber borchii TaxID=42251 RepID=A0A2T6ZWQ7_TUBBO|nr:hypothetical protein B9Z19DRAFT_1063905 [Tuber borchii]